MTQEKLALVFPGQGSQKVGMMAEASAAFAAVRETYSEASDTLGYDMWALIQSGPQEDLNLTETTQPVLLSSSVAIRPALSTDLPWRLSASTNTRTVASAAT